MFMRTTICIAVLAALSWTGVASAQGQVQIPSEEVQVMLIRNCLTAVNHASITGNFTVMRDLGSEQFRQRFKAADLSNSFQILRQQNIDLSPVLLHPPVLTQPTELSPEGRLRMTGMCPTQPLAIGFDIYYQYGPLGWAIDEVDLALADQTAQPQQVAVSDPPQPQSPMVRDANPFLTPYEPTPVIAKVPAVVSLPSTAE